MTPFDERCGDGVHWRLFARNRFENSDNFRDSDGRNVCERKIRDHEDKVTTLMMIMLKLVTA